MTTLRTIDAAQRTAAKVAGFLYLFTLATANFAEFYARGRLIVPSDVRPDGQQYYGV